MFQYDNPFFQGVRKLLGLVVLCAVFLVCCLPVFTAGAAFAALYDAVEKNMKHDRGYPAQEFLSGFRANFKKATVCFLVILASAVVCLLDIRVMSVLAGAGKISAGFRNLFYVIFILIAVWAVWVLAQCVRFENSAGALLKNGIVLTLLHIPASLGILAVLTFGVLVIYLLPVTILIMPGVMVWFITMLTEKVFRVHMTTQERQQYDEINRI